MHRRERTGLCEQNRYSRLVAMDIDYRERTMQYMEEERMVNRGIDDYEREKVTDRTTDVTRTKS